MVRKKEALKSDTANCPDSANSLDLPRRFSMGAISQIHRDDDEAERPNKSFDNGRYLARSLYDFPDLRDAQGCFLAAREVNLGYTARDYTYTYLPTYLSTYLSATSQWPTRSRYGFLTVLSKLSPMPFGDRAPKNVRYSEIVLITGVGIEEGLLATLVV